MNAIQAKLLGSLLFIVGFGALAFGVYELWQVWDYNQDIASADSVVGGLLNSVSDVLGTQLEMSYRQGGIICALAVLPLLGGWLILGKVK